MPVSADYRGRRYDAVFFVECVHDMAHPATALRAARDPAQLFFAAASVVWCLPQARRGRLRIIGHRDAHRRLPSHRRAGRLHRH